MIEGRNHHALEPQEAQEPQELPRHFWTPGSSLFSEGSQGPLRIKSLHLPVPRLRKLFYELGKLVIFRACLL